MNKAEEVEKWKQEKMDYARIHRELRIPDRMYNNEISSWKDCCHYCNRAKNIVGAIGNDGLCDFCRNNGRRASW